MSTERTTTPHDDLVEVVKDIALAPWTTIHVTRRQPEHVFIAAGGTSDKPELVAALLIATEDNAEGTAVVTGEDGVFRGPATIVAVLDDFGPQPVTLSGVAHASAVTQKVIAPLFWLWPFEARDRYQDAEALREIHRRTPEQRSRAGRRRIEGMKKAKQL